MATPLCSTAGVPLYDASTGNPICSSSPSTCPCCLPHKGCTLCDNYNTTPPAVVAGGKSATIVLAGATNTDRTAACCDQINASFLLTPPWIGGYPSCSITSGFPGDRVSCSAPSAAMAVSVEITYDATTNQTTIDIDATLSLNFGGTLLEPVIADFALVVSGQLDCDAISGLNIPLVNYADNGCQPGAMTCTLTLS